MKHNTTLPPELSVTQWFNTPQALSLADLRGEVVVLHTFQMLCPGCVSHGLPQAQRIHDTFDRDSVCVIGLHTVFEHHAAMTPVALQAFIHEYRLSFPIGVDTPGSDGPIPETMKAYSMRGTPSLLLFDRQGRLRHHSFGRDDDLQVGASIMALVCEDENVEPLTHPVSDNTGAKIQGVCTQDGCESG